MKKIGIMFCVMVYCVPVMTMNMKEETKALLAGDLAEKNKEVVSVHPKHDAIERSVSPIKAQPVNHRYMNRQGIVNSFVCKDACWPCVFIVTSPHCFCPNYCDPYYLQYQSCLKNQG